MTGGGAGEKTGEETQGGQGGQVRRHKGDGETGEETQGGRGDR